MYQYSNSLIRQFPSQVTGNAAVGVQATVYVGETSALASLFESNGTTPKSNPVTTDDKGFYSFSVADGDYRIVFSSGQFADLRFTVLDGAQIREDFDALIASNTAFRNEQQAAYDSFVASQGLYPSEGSFEAGGTITERNQFLQLETTVGAAVAGAYTWGGALPKAVAASSDPLTAGGIGPNAWVYRGDATVSAGLADGTQNIAGLTAEQLTKSDIRKYGTTADDVADLINAAIAATGFAYVPYGTWTHRGGTVNLDNGQCIQFQNPTINSDGVNFATFINVADKFGWALLGRCFYIGSLTTGADVGAEIALNIVGCNKYTVENFIAFKCRSHGIKVSTGGLAPAPRGDQGQFIGCSAVECRVGIENGVDSSTEFNVWTNFTIAGCIDGLITPAGNAIYSAGNVVDNTRGITITNGPNHAHGIITGVNVNHNSEHNIKCVGVTNGQTFNAIHAYGNGGTTSPIIFENSKDCVIQNSKIDCPIYCNGTTGINAILNNNMPGSDAQILGTNPEYLRVLGNWTDTGSWIFNDTSGEFAQASRATSEQSLASNTTLIFNNAIKDKRGLINTTTGIFTAPISGYVDVTCQLIFGGSGMTAGQGIGFVSLLNGATTVSYATVTAISSTLALCSFSDSVLCAAADQLKITNSASATGLELRANQSRITFSMG